MWESLCVFVFGSLSICVFDFVSLCVCLPVSVYVCVCVYNNDPDEYITITVVRLFLFALCVSLSVSLSMCLCHCSSVFFSLTVCVCLCTGTTTMYEVRQVRHTPYQNILRFSRFGRLILSMCVLVGSQNFLLPTWTKKPKKSLSFFLSSFF